jgi:hypothetical protein
VVCEGFRAACVLLRRPAGVVCPVLARQHVCVCVCVCVRMYMCICVYAYSRCIYVYTHAHTHTQTHTHTHTHTHTLTLLPHAPLQPRYLDDDFGAASRKPVWASGNAYHHQPASKVHHYLDEVFIHASHARTHA